MNLLVLIPSRGLVSARTINSIFQECERTDAIESWSMYVSGPGHTAEVRTELMHKFVQTESADVSMWVDDDVVLPPGVLSAMLQTQGAVVGCHVMNRVTGPNIWKGPFVAPDNMRRANGRVTFVGIALCIMRRDVCQIPKPWFGSVSPYSYYGEDNFFNDLLEQHKLEKSHVPFIAEHLEVATFRARPTERIEFKDEPGGHSFRSFPPQPVLYSYDGV